MASDMPPLRKTRWLVAALIIVAGAVYYTAQVITDARASCQEKTITDTVPGPRSGAYVQTTKACGGPNTAEFIYVLAAAGIFLLPDARNLKIGGLEFERLTSQVEAQTREISQLRQTVSTTINIGAAQTFVAEARVAFREQKAKLDVLRTALPSEPRIIEQLRTIDDVAQRADGAPLTELINVITTAHGLIAEAQSAAEAELLRSGTAGDTAEAAAEAQDADAVVREILNPPPLGHQDRANVPFWEVR